MLLLFPHAQQDLWYFLLHQFLFLAPGVHHSSISNITKIIYLFIHAPSTNQEAKICNETVLSKALNIKHALRTFCRHYHTNTTRWLFGLLQFLPDLPLKFWSRAQFWYPWGPCWHLRYLWISMGILGFESASTQTSLISALRETFLSSWSNFFLISSRSTSYSAMSILPLSSL